MFFCLKNVLLSLKNTHVLSSKNLFFMSFGGKHDTCV